MDRDSRWQQLEITMSFPFAKSWKAITASKTIESDRSVMAIETAWIFQWSSEKKIPFKRQRIS
jgi:hypothetical protein